MRFDKIKDERGGIMLMFAAFITVVFLCAAIALDFARYVLAAEKLQTAVDSASLAAAGTAHRYVNAHISFGEQAIP